MNRLVVVLTIALLLSVMLNIFLWFERPIADDPDNLTVKVPTASQDHSAINTDTSESLTQQAQTDIADKANHSTSTEIDGMRALLQKRQYAEVGRQLSIALRNAPDSIELLLLEAEYIARTEPLSEAVLNYYALLERPLETAMLEHIEETIDTLVEQAIAPLRQGQQWDLLAQFMEPLFQRLPNNKAYILLLAEAYGQQSNYTLMENTLASLPNNDPQAMQVRQQAYDSSDTSQTVADNYDYVEDDGNFNVRAAQRISLVRVGDQFLVDIAVERSPVSLLIDTGASITALSQQTFEQLSARYDSQFLGVFDVNTAGGPIRAPMVTFKRVALGSYVFEDLPMLVLPTELSGRAQGLLGMNLLKVFDFRIDQRDAVLLLREY